MNKIKLAFQGEKGAYSHIACEEIFKGAEIKNCSTFEETFKFTFENEDVTAIALIDTSTKEKICFILESPNISFENNALQIQAA